MPLARRKNKRSAGLFRLLEVKALLTKRNARRFGQRFLSPVRTVLRSDLVHELAEPKLREFALPCSTKQTKARGCYAPRRLHPAGWFFRCGSSDRPAASSVLAGSSEVLPSPLQ